MKHIPVLENEIVECFSYLNRISDGFFVDGTIGAGGHSLALTNNLQLPAPRSLFVQRSFSEVGGEVGTTCLPVGMADNLIFIGIDKDKSALGLAKANIKKAGEYDNFILIHDDFKNIKEVLNSICHSDAKQKNLSDDRSFTNVQDDKWGNVQDDKRSSVQNNIKDTLNNNLINGALLDLGVSSMQLDQKDRGFSFTNAEAKLDMRMDQSQKLDAISVLNHYSEEKIEKILRQFGEEKFSRVIAKNICLARKNKHIETVGDLIYILEKSIPIKIQKTSRSHFATKTFQAIRIEVNGELENLEKSLRDFVNTLKPGGHLAVITFHSLEDRIVKYTFRDLASNCSCPDNAPICNCNKIAEVRLVNKKPIVANDKEILENPRSRSAKLRIVEKI